MTLIPAILDCGLLIPRRPLPAAMPGVVRPVT